MIVFLKAVAEFLSFVPGWVYAIAVASLLATNCATSLMLDKAKLNLAELTAVTETAKADAERRRADQERAHRETEATWLRKLKENTNAADKRLAKARVDSAAAVDAGSRLRERIAAIGQCPGEATAVAPVAGASAPARSASDLLADVRRRIDEATDGIAEFADRSRIAGQACERASDEMR